jgi:predicted GNAT family N-acyltransferase
VEFRIERVPAADTWELRQAVLRPLQSPEQLALDDDDRPSTASFAAIDQSGRIVGTGRVAAESPPPSLGDEWAGGKIPSKQTAWRLRGMATSEDTRNAGVGSAVLVRIIRHVAEHGGGLLWCNARVPALTLYERAGFAGHGAVWEDPDIGPHLVMWRSVDPIDRH